MKLKGRSWPGLAKIQTRTTGPSVAVPGSANCPDKTQYLAVERESNIIML